MPISTTRALSLNTAKFIQLGPQPLVEGSLDHASLNHVIPIVAAGFEARDLLGSQGSVWPHQCRPQSARMIRLKQ